ncbi:TPA: ead/Ea22-like family protein [Pseudomonas aeruginosa]|nr:ead/Ea22-like family protein [Pseudomonas aeruginosa]
MTDHAELRRLAEEATPGPWGRDGLYIHTTRKEGGTTYVETWNTLAGILRKENAEFVATANPKTVLALLDEIDRLKAENDALRGSLQAVEAEVDGNLRPLTRDLVNMVSGLKNGSHPNDIYEHCDEIERIIGAALEGNKP